MLRFFRLMPLGAFLMSMAAQAQSFTAPLAHDGSRVAPVVKAGPGTAARTTALSLPFFDDFTVPTEGNPLVQNWLPDGGALVSNRLGVLPLTRGTASLDGLDANGNYYNGYNTANAYGPTDVLTSQAIDLSGRTAASLVYFSFAWQSGSVAGPHTAVSGPGHVISLELQFYDAAGTGRWVSQWTRRSTGLSTNFRQQVVAVADPRFLTANFRFRFLATGDRTSGQDVWGLDYIYLNDNRTAGLADTTYVDIATTTGLSNPLRRFTAMPWWQFNAAPTPTDELNPLVVAGLINLNLPGIPTPIIQQGRVADLNAGGGPLGTWLQSNRSLQTVPRRDTIKGDARRVPIPLTPTPKRLRYTVALTTYADPTGRTLHNDTTSRDVALSTYYAYDDGTAEAAVNLPGGSNSYNYLAYRFALNQPDQVRGLQVAPIFSSAGSRPVTIFLWEDNNGTPGRQIATATATIPNPLPPGQVFYQVDFPTSVPVTGSFFIGLGQPPQSGFQLYGRDLNNDRPANTFFLNIAGTWTPTVVTPVPGSGIPPLPGAPMFRPVLTHNITVSASRNVAPSEAFSLFPNPAHGTVTVAGVAFARAAVLDAVGRTVWTQPGAEAGQPVLSLPALPPGFYLVRLALANGRSISQRLALE